MREATATLRANGEAPLRIGVVADTHSRPHPDTARHLAAFAPDAILHAGDIGELEVLGGLAAIAPVHAVRGNIDVRAPDLPDVLVIDAFGPTGTRLRMLVTHIAVNGPKIRADAARLARAHAAELIVCGHSHVPFLGRDRGLAVFNPGSIGPRRFTLPILFGTIVIDASGARFAHVDCETGLRWNPP
ncbi:MAG: metallophosphoesterase family protein [Deltaproteobacteria bacterium]|nr:metallophosphoesterase family protein [Nannocystaceae bacterium]